MNRAQKRHSRRPSPYKRVVTQGDINKATKAAQNTAIEAAWSILFTVLRDKEGMDVEDLQRVWGEVNNLSDSIARGYIDVADLRDVLREEAGIALR